MLRGKWVLDNLLDAPPPEPPADVPNLDESTIGTAASMREQLEEHRKNPTCASCHRRMDPLGFGLENFDAVGAWRTRTASSRSTRRASSLTAARSTARTSCATILSAEREAFSRAITSKLLTYALGRGLERYDARTVRQIASRLPEHDYKFSGLVLEIVNSLPFTSRRSARWRPRTTRPTAPIRERDTDALPDRRLPARDRSSEGRRTNSIRSASVMIVTRKHLHRRTFLKGMGAVVALPVLDAMTPAFAAAARREGAAAAGVHLRAERHRHGRLDADGGRARSSSTRAC